VQSGLVVGHVSGFSSSVYVVLKGLVLALLLVSGLLVGSGAIDLCAFSNQVLFGHPDNYVGAALSSVCLVVFQSSCVVRVNF